MTFRKAKPRQYKDYSGRRLSFYGLQTSRADKVIYVCLDTNPLIGRKLHVMQVPPIKAELKRLLREGWPLTPGGPMGTALGYIFYPHDFDAASYELPEEDDATGTASERGDRLARKWLRQLRWNIRSATHDEQLQQIDLVVWKGAREYSIEVKSRDEKQRHLDALYFQTHESNANKKYI